MTWQLASFTILGLGLLGGFAWYERIRPDARLIALVGTLAAFAALGRIAFAALPNVKPTTDIVLISGYALGAAPGFVIGATAGLSSNLFFGQGPWTPWQMVAWGMAGLVGAAMAKSLRRPAGRGALALVCGIVGLAFTAFQDFGDWVTYSDHSARQLGVYLAKGFGFDAVHALGCVVFALAFGPALARSIGRFAARLQVKWIEPSRALAAPAAALVLALGAVAAPPVHAAATPAGYLLGAQNPDGGFGPAPGAPSTPMFSGWAALGLAATGSPPQNVVHGGASLLDYVRSGSPGDVGSLERAILVLRSAGAPAGAWVSQLEGDIRGDGSVQDQVNLTAFAVLALRAAGLAPPPATMSWLAAQQDADGGFNFATAGGTSDVDDTGAALEALAGSRPSLFARAVRFIEGQENADGGFPSQPGAASNAQSTAWAIQGLLAAGVPPGSLARPLAYLRSLTAPDGHIRYSSQSDQTPVWVTGEALMALALRPLPYVAPGQAAPVRPQPAVAPALAPSARSRRRAARAAVRPARPAAAAQVGRRTGHRRHPARGGGIALDQLAADAGVATAFALAPIG